MNVHLLSATTECQLEAITPLQQALFFDVEFEYILQAMAQGDEDIQTVCQRVIAQPLQSQDDILYRQAVIKDVHQHRQPIDHMVRLINDAIHAHSKEFFLSSRNNPSVCLYSSRNYCVLALKAIEMLRSHLASTSWLSPAMQGLKQRLTEQFTPDYCQQLRHWFDYAQLKKSTNIGVTLTPDLAFKSILLCDNPKTSRFKTLLGNHLLNRAPRYEIPERGEAIFNAISDIKRVALWELSSLFKQLSDTFIHFFKQLNWQLRFYQGADNLFNQSEKLSLNVHFPQVNTHNELNLTGFYDLALALKNKASVVSNDLHTKAQHLIITGANQGGKTTYLRALGQQFIMAQSGLFTASRSASTPIYTNLYSHFKREEAHNQPQGKLLEELGRIDHIIDHLSSQCCLLLNESFSSTNEMEGSLLLKQITDALELGAITCFNVTHLYEYTQLCLQEDEHNDARLFLRAVRKNTAQRSFKIEKGLPEKTAYAQDIYALMKKA